MLNNASGFCKIYIAAGYTDLRRGIDGLASIVKFTSSWIHMKRISYYCSVEDAVTESRDSYGKGTAFSSLYKRLDLGRFSWPRTKEEALEITLEQYRTLMQGLEIVSIHPIQEVQPTDFR